MDPNSWFSVKAKRMNSLGIFVPLLAFIGVCYATECHCIFIKGTSETDMMDSLKFVCSQPGFSCDPIHPNGTSFYPDTVLGHASWAINAWYKAHADNPTQSCDFKSTTFLNCDDCTCNIFPTATDQELQKSIDYICSILNCAPINSSGSNYLPNTVRNHAAWAVNAWYQTYNWTPESCQFNGIAYLSPLSCTGSLSPDCSSPKCLSTNTSRTAMLAGIIASVLIVVLIFIITCVIKRRAIKKILKKRKAVSAIAPTSTTPATIPTTPPVVQTPTIPTTIPLVVQTPTIPTTIPLVVQNSSSVQPDGPSSIYNDYLIQLQLKKC